MTRKLNRWLVFFAVLFALPYWWLMLDNRQGSAAAKPLHMAELRALASQISGTAPDAVEAENMANRSTIKGLYVAGAGLKRYALAFLAFRLNIPDAPPIIIDSGVDEKIADQLGTSQFDRSSAQRVQTALLHANKILLTHGHIDHISGLNSLLSHLKSQKLSAQIIRGNPASTPANPPLAPRAIAAGVVAIPAPSHSPDSQIYYVRLQNGREYLFTGDIAPYIENFQQIRGKARFLDYLYDKEDRREVYAWLMTLHQLQQEAPDLIIVPAHDYAWLWLMYQQGLVKQNFTPEPPISDKSA